MSVAGCLLTARLAPIVGLGLLLTTVAAATTDGHIQGWITEPGIDPPSYAVTEPIDSDVNVDTVLLLCTETGGRRAIELDLYLSTEGPLFPRSADPRRLKLGPRVQIKIDGQEFPAELLFADEYVVVTDVRGDNAPALSRALLDAMQQGETMVLRFDLVAEPAGQHPAFDSEIVLDLAAGRTAIAAVRQCAPASERHQALVR
jgi:hypothetical protein